MISRCILPLVRQSAVRSSIGRFSGTVKAREVLKRRLSDVSRPSSATPPSTSTPGTKEAESTTDKVVKFMDDNGGKLVLLAIGFLVTWGYTYYESMQDRDRIEKSVLHDSNIEPYEIQMLRAKNSIPLDTYKLLMDEFASEGWTWNTEISYTEVVRTAQRVLPPLKLAYLLDRAVYHHATRKGALLADQTADINAADVNIPVHYFLALLNLCMESNVEARLEGLYYACSILNYPENKEEQEGVESVKRNTLVELIQSLVDTDQVR